MSARWTFFVARILLVVTGISGCELAGGLENPPPQDPVLSAQPSVEAGTRPTAGPGRAAGPEKVTTPEKDATPGDATAAPDARPAGFWARLEASAKEHKRAESLYFQARTAARRGEDRLRSHALLDEALELHPRHVKAWALKARLHREAGELSKASGALEEAIDRVGESDVLTEEKARLELAQGDPNAALELIDERLADRNGGAPALRVLRAVSLAELDDVEGTLAALQDAVDNGFLAVRKLKSEKPLALVADNPRFHAIVEGVQERIRRAQEGALERGAD